MSNKGGAADLIAARRQANLTLIAAGLAYAQRPRLKAAADRILTAVGPPDETIWPYLLRRAQETRVVPMLRQLCACQGWKYPDLDGLADAHAVAQRVLFETLPSAISALHGVGVTPAVIKGGDYAWSLYPTDAPRQMADVDLLIKPHEIKAASEAMCGAGFFQGSFNRDTLQIAPLAPAEMDAFIRQHYELPPFLKLARCRDLEPYLDVVRRYCVPRDTMLWCGTEMFLLVEVDVHFNLSFDLALEDVWALPREVTAFGRMLPALAWETQVWFLCGRIYVEALAHGAATLRTFVDLLVILERGPLSWERVIAAVEYYEIFPSLHYVLDLARQILPEFVPAAVLERCLHEVLTHRHESGNRGPLIDALLDGVATQPLLIK